MMKPPMLGDQELQVLRYVTDNSPISIRDVATQFGEPLGLARTTILTVMERLRKKGFLERKKNAGIYVYLPSITKQALMQNIVGDFVQRTLGGSISPFVAYLSDNKNISQEDIEELKYMISELEKDR